MPFLLPNQQRQSTDGTRKVKPNWILLKQETVSGSGISWANSIKALKAKLKQIHQQYTYVTLLYSFY